MDIDMSDADRKKLAGIIAGADITNAVRPVIDAMPQINANMNAVSQAMQGLNIAPSITASLNQWNAVAALTQTAEQYSCYRLNSAVTAAIKSLDVERLTESCMSMQSVADSLSDAMSKVTISPFIEWINAFDFSSLRQVFENAWSGILSPAAYEALKRAYLQKMYDCQWFPYAGLRADAGLRKEIDRIFSTSKPEGSKRRIARTDKAIIAYYTPAEIRRIKREWNASDVKPYTKRMIGQAIEAHLRGEYALTVTCLATLWESLLYTKMPRKKQTNDEKRQAINSLIDNNGYDTILGDYYGHFIIGECRGTEDIIDGVPNRHGVAHGWYNKYPSKKASLNSILLTDFIISLTPKDLTGGIEKWTS